MTDKSQKQSQESPISAELNIADLEFLSDEQLQELKGGSDYKLRVNVTFAGLPVVDSGSTASVDLPGLWTLVLYLDKLLQKNLHNPCYASIMEI